MTKLLLLQPRERLHLSRWIETAGYLPVKGRRVQKVFATRWFPGLPVYYDGPTLGEPRRANTPRRALIEP